MKIEKNESNSSNDFYCHSETSKENQASRKTNENGETQQKDYCEDVKAKKNLLRLIIILVIVIISLIIIGLTLYFFFGSKEKGKKTDIEIKEGNIIKNNEYYFTATYKSKNGKNIKLFNPSRLGLQEGQYFIYESTKGSNLRRIEEIDVANGVLNSTKDGFIQIKVNFTDSFSNLDFMFEGCEDLLNINLSNISSSINSMIYTFTNCENLQKVDFTSLDTSNVTDMDFLFAGCNNLVEITNFDTINASSVTKTAGMFADCISLISANLSAFDIDNVEEPNGMFINNPSLQLVDLGNCTDANELFSSESDFNLTIITNENITVINESYFTGNFTFLNRFEFEFPETYFHLFSKIICRIGERDLCKECDEINALYCKSCNKGYYLPPKNINPPLKCQKCEEGCEECFFEEQSESSSCISCIEGYEIFKGKCIKNCEIGEDEKCKECKTTPGSNNQCLNCNKGYYFEINYNKTICKKIEINNCTEAVFESNTLTCINCSLGYMLYNNECIKSCNIGEGEGCASCNPIYELRQYCNSCNPGYYLDYDINPTRCQSCEIEHCEKCEKISGNIKCTSCKENYTLFNDTCFQSCEENCINCYFDGINKGECLECKKTFFLKNNYTLVDNLYKNEKFCSPCPEGCTHCFDYFIGNDKVSLNCTTCLPGYNLINSICDKQCDVGDNDLCLTCQNTTKNRCGSCNQGYYLDNIYGTCNSCNVDNCIECQNIRKCSKCIDGYEVLNRECFLSCEKGPNEKCLECNNTEYKISRDCSRCNKGYYLPDDSSNKTKCIPCEIGCNICSGKIGNSICISCEEGFQLYNNKCIKGCILGSEELCKTCDYLNNDSYCGSCNDNYYLPHNLSERKKCKKCGYNMIKCHEENNSIIPDECYYPFVPSGTKCMRQCNNGTGNLCLSCSDVPEEIDKCGLCNPGYFLPNNTNKEECYSCGNGCKKCNGTTSYRTCTECYNNYMPYEGKCIQNCNTKFYSYYCRTCNPEPGKNDRCLTCNEGYYLPTYSTDIYYRNTYCSFCNINNCKTCIGDYGNPNCTQCKSEYFHLKNNKKCLKNCLYSKTFDHCSYCLESNDYETFANCTKCINGYYLPKNRIMDEYYNVCYKCSMVGCIECEGDNNETNICTKCDNNLEPLIINGTIISCYNNCEIGEGSKCKSCKGEKNICGECNEEYMLYKNKCVLEYHIFAKYKTTKQNEYVKFMNYDEIKKLKINDTIIKNPSRYFTFQNPGEHKVYIKLKAIDVFSDLFTNIKHLIYIEFSDNFDSSKILYMNDCFSGCTNLISIDMSRLNLSKNRCFMNLFKNDINLEEVKFPEKEFHNIYWFYRMFYGCKKLTTIDMSNVYNDNGEYFYEMFYGCEKLETLYLPNFRKSYKGPSNYDMFVNVSKNATIIINEAFFDSVKDQLVDFPEAYPY